MIINQMDLQYNYDNLFKNEFLNPKVAGVVSSTKPTTRPHLNTADVPYPTTYVPPKPFMALGEKNNPEYAYKLDPPPERDPNLYFDRPLSRKEKKFPEETKDVRYLKSAVSVDSRDRNILPINIVGEEVALGANPMNFLINSTTVTIVQPNHGYAVTQNIEIRNANTTPVQLPVPPFSLAPGPNFNFLRVNQPNSGLTAAFNNLNYLYLTISGSIGTTPTFFGNIPLNFINNTHLLFMTSFVGEPVSPDYYYIQLPEPFFGPLPANNNKVFTQFLFTNGVPLNDINTGYPSTFAHLFGFQTVTAVINTDAYNIELSQEALITGIGGGSNMYVTPINSIEDGYPEANSYTILLKRTFYNVVKIRLISCEMPNTNRVVVALPSAQANNSLFWQNYTDGNNMYQVSITPGNYTPASLVKELEYQFSLIPRINTSMTPAPTVFHNFKVTIDTSTDVVTFQSLVKNALPLSLSIITVVTTFTDYILNVNQPNNNLTVGDTVIITNSLDISGVPRSKINGTHVITTIIDVNNYQINLGRLNAIGNPANTMGGEEVVVITFDIFQMFFNLPGTLGTVLGFANVGSTYSFTPFTNKVQNNNPYEFDVSLPAVVAQNDEPYQQHLVNLSGANYIFMTSDILGSTVNNTGFLNTGGVLDIFAKIQLTDEPGKTLFNTYVCYPKRFLDPLPTLSQITVQFNNFDGSLYDFTGAEHSYTLEITERIPHPKDTEISERSNTKSDPNILLV